MFLWSGLFISLHFAFDQEKERLAERGRGGGQGPELYSLHGLKRATDPRKCLSLDQRKKGQGSFDPPGRGIPSAHDGDRSEEFWVWKGSRFGGEDRWRNMENPLNLYRADGREGPYVSISLGRYVRRKVQVNSSVYGTQSIMFETLHSIVGNISTLYRFNED